MLTQFLKPAKEQTDHGHFGSPHRLGSLGDRATFQVVQLDGLALILRQST